MKKIFAIVMSLQLICSPLAFAAETDLPAVSETAPPVVSSPNQSSSDALRDNPDTGADVAYYGQQLLTVATSCLGANIMVACSLGWMQTSLYLFMSGSIVQIMGEIAGAKALNDSYQRSAENLKLSEKKLKEAQDSGGTQASTIDAAIQEQEGMEKFIRDRATWTWVLSGFYWAAMAMAIIERWYSLPPPVGIALTDIAGCTPVGIPSMGLTAAGIITVYSAMASGLPQAIFGDKNQVKTNHGLTSTLAIAAGLATLIPSVGSGVTAAYQESIGRAITFGAFGALVTALGISYELKLGTVRDNLAKLNQVKEDMEETKDDNPDKGVTGSSSSGSVTPNVDSSNFSSKSSTASVKSSQTCGSMSDKGFSTGSDCSKPVKLKAPDFGDNFDIPELQSFTNQGTELANAAARGDTAAANAQASSLASKAGRMRAIAEKLKKKLNDDLKKAGLAEIDFDKEINNKLVGLNQQYNEAAAKKGLPLASTDGKAFLDAVKSADGLSASAPSGALAGAKPAAAAKGFGLKGFDVGNEEIKPEVQANTPTLSDSLGQFESNVSDISNKKEVSIFALLSNRYVLSYEKIMKRKESKIEEKKTEESKEKK
jgi:hypothetical protein